MTSFNKEMNKILGNKKIKDTKSLLIGAVDVDSVLCLENDDGVSCVPYDLNEINGKSGVMRDANGIYMGIMNNEFGFYKDDDDNRHFEITNSSNGIIKCGFEKYKNEGIIACKVYPHVCANVTYEVREGTERFNETTPEPAVEKDIASRLYRYSGGEKVVSTINITSDRLDDVFVSPMKGNNKMRAKRNRDVKIRKLNDDVKSVIYKNLNAISSKMGVPKSNINISIDRFCV